MKTAQTPAQLATQITGWNHGGSGTITATPSGNSVNVTGSMTGAVLVFANVLTLTISPGVMVNWGANVTIASSSTTMPFVLQGDGAFVLSSGTVINNNSNTYAFNVTGGVDVTIAGTLNAPNSSSTGIRLFGDGSSVTISAGTINTNGRGIAGAGNGCSVTVAGDAITTTNNSAIDIGLSATEMGNNCTVNISGGEVKTNGARPTINADNTYTSGTNIAVGGTGKVTQEGTDSAIRIGDGSLTVQDNAVISAVGNDAIFLDGTVVATFSGGTITGSGTSPTVNHGGR